MSKHQSGEKVENLPLTPSAHNSPPRDNPPVTAPVAKQALAPLVKQGSALGFGSVKGGLGQRLILSSQPRDGASSSTPNH